MVSATGDLLVQAPGTNPEKHGKLESPEVESAQPTGAIADIAQGHRQGWSVQPAQVDQEHSPATVISIESITPNLYGISIEALVRGATIRRSLPWRSQPTFYTYLRVISYIAKECQR